jgi:RimJ/RimL family protein N-acetyltransferase
VSDTTIAASFREAAGKQLDDLVLREESEADLAFLEALYASTRADELAPVPWPDEQKRAFLAHQFALQREQYRRHYPGAEWLLLELAGQPVGRLYLRRGGTEVRLMDIALLTAWRGAGVGTRVTRALLDWADALALPVTLHVEPFNPAYRMYRRFGFAYVRSTGVYHFLQRAVGAAAEPDQTSRLPRRD